MRRPYIVAEMSANHLGDYDRACALVDAAADSGADAIKVQVWERDTMCLDPGYKLTSGPWQGYLLRDLYRECFTPWYWLSGLFHRARRRGLEPFGAAFDRESVDLLEQLGVERHKVASFELTDVGLVEYAASKRKPLILSTGMATRKEIMHAVHVAERHTRDVTLLTCTSAYPADCSQAHLARLHALRPDGGLSDHTPGIGVAVAAAALGATVIEKHLTLRRSDGGPDAGFSLEPHEFAQMVVECRRAAVSVGESYFGPMPGEDVTLRRGWWSIKPIAAGEPLTGLVRTARPHLGISAAARIDTLRARRDIPACSPIQWEDVQP